VGTVVSRTFYTHRNLLNRSQGELQAQCGSTEEEEKTHFSSWNRYILPQSLSTVYTVPGTHAYVLQGIQISRWLKVSDTCEDEGQFDVRVSAHP